eukprot:scaffold675965_cov70-Prasinocladus_malaysianus.AAC.1
MALESRKCLLRTFSRCRVSQTRGNDLCMNWCISSNGLVLLMAFGAEWLPTVWNLIAFEKRSMAPSAAVTHT